MKISRCCNAETKPLPYADKLGICQRCLDVCVIVNLEKENHSDKTIIRTVLTAILIIIIGIGWGILLHYLGRL